MAVERVFTEEEANALIPRIRELLDSLDRALVTESGEASGSGVAGNGSATRAASVSGARDAAEAVVRGLSELGVIVRDLASGLMDFPALRDGQAVFLCWRRDEDRIGYWHDRVSGYSGRRPL